MNNMKLRQRTFIIGLITIALIGFLLRLTNYDRIPPFAETRDEFFYPWAGMTMLQGKSPVAWSFFSAYPNPQLVKWWGVEFPIVSPWVEKPPLYSLITGGWMILNGARELTDVRLSVLRIVPLILSLITILATGILSGVLFGPIIGLAAALIYATTPAIVMANRLSLTENLLTPLVLLTLIVFVSHKFGKWQVWLVGLGSFLAVLTKNVGIALAVPLLIFYFCKKDKRSFLIVGIATAIATLIHPLMGWYYGWDIFTKMLVNYRVALALSGLPELLSTIFGYPTITTKAQLFPDGTLLLGLILLFTSPLWFIQSRSLTRPESFDFAQDKLRRGMTIFQFKRFKFSFPNFTVEHLFLSFPLVYFLLLSMLASGTSWSYFGWHIYPLYPFMVILIATLGLRLLKENNLFLGIIAVVAIGASSIRFFFLNQPQSFGHLWQYVYIGLIALVVISSFSSQKVRVLIWLSLFGLFIGVNVYTVINLSYIYPSLVQPAL